MAFTAHDPSRFRFFLKWLIVAILSYAAGVGIGSTSVLIKNETLLVAVGFVGLFLMFAAPAFFLYALFGSPAKREKATAGSTVTPSAERTLG